MEIVFKVFKLKLKSKDDKSLVSNKLIYDQYKSVPRLTIVFIDEIKYVLNKGSTQIGIIKRFRYKRDEEKTLPVIIEAFRDIYKIEYQYKVGSYFIDLYIPELNLAIECDENNHSRYNIKKEYNREKYIRDVLDCEFIRFNPNEIGFKNIDIVNKIIKYSFKKEKVS